VSRSRDVDDICEIFLKSESKHVVKEVWRVQTYSRKRNGVGQMTRGILRQQRRAAMQEESEVPPPTSGQTEQLPLPCFIAPEAESRERPQHPSIVSQATIKQLPPVPARSSLTAVAQP